MVPDAPGPAESAADVVIIPTSVPRVSQYGGSVRILADHGNHELATALWFTITFPTRIHVLERTMFGIGIGPVVLRDGDCAFLVNEAPGAAQVIGQDEVTTAVPVRTYKA